MLNARAVRVGFSVLSVSVVLTSSSSQALAQEVDPNPGAITLTGGMDVVNAYMFRGILQDDTKVISWPFADIGIALHSGDSRLKSVSLNVGSWNSLHPGAGGTEGPTGKLWYEGDFYATLGLAFANGLGLSSTYTAYTSPNNRFSTVKELGLKASFADRLGLNPYALVAFELDTAPGRGQADGGVERGTYMEFGLAAPLKVFGPKVTVAVPAKVGFSLGDYYEHPVTGEDSAFGYASLARHRVGASGRHDDPWRVERARRPRAPAPRRDDEGLQRWKRRPDDRVDRYRFRVPDRAGG